MYTRATMAIVGLAVLGYDFGPIDEKTRFQDLYDAAFSPPGLGGVIRYVNAFLPVRWLPIQANRDFISGMDEIKTMLRHAIRRRRSQVLEGKGEANELLTKDVLGYMFENIRPDGAQHEVWSEDEILGHVSAVHFLFMLSTFSSNKKEWNFKNIF